MAEKGMHNKKVKPGYCLASVHVIELLSQNRAKHFSCCNWISKVALLLPFTKSLTPRTHGCAETSTTWAVIDRLFPRWSISLTVTTPSPSHNDCPVIAPGSTFVCLHSSQCREVLTCDGGFLGEEPVWVIYNRKDWCFAVSANCL